MILKKYELLTRRGRYKNMQQEVVDRSKVITAESI
jgi:hypothetical protein